MPILSLQLETISPLFLYGANQQQPELRAASVRGQLRYWARAILGAKNADIADVRKCETELFGSTKQGSPFTFRVREVEENPIKEHIKDEIPMLPHKGKNPSKRGIDESAQFWLDIVSRPTLAFDDPLWAEMRNIISVWLLLGGLGMRSRRINGGFDLVNYEPFEENMKPKWWNEPHETVQDLIDVIKNQINEVVPPNKAAPSSGGLPKFPQLHPEHSQIMVCKKPFNNSADADKALFSSNLLHNPKYHNKSVFGGISPRRPSPLIAQTRLVNDQVYLVLTAMRSKPPVNGWELMKDFLDDCERQLQGKTVWGGL
jgi:CRISPR-associated protein Cmr1